MGKATLVLLLTLAGLAARSVGFLHRVFTDDLVTLQGEDAWIHYRQVQLRTRDLGQDLRQDPYLIFPERTAVPVAPLFDVSAALIVRALYGADATDRQVATVCAWFPPALGALTVVVVFFLGCRFSSVRAGLVAAGVTAICPSLFFYHSRLGAADHHVLEVLLTSAYALALLRALNGKPIFEPPTSCSGRLGPRERNAGAGIFVAGRTMNSIAAGLILVLYLWTWIGGSYWVVIVASWAAFEYGQRHLRGESVTELTYALVPGMVATSLILLTVPLTYPLRALQTSVLCWATVMIVIMHALSRTLARRGVREVWFLIVILLAGILGVTAWAWVNPALLSKAVWLASSLLPNRRVLPIEETLPLFSKEGVFSLAPVWSMFALSFPLALAGLFFVIPRAVRRAGTSAAFLVVWSLINFISMAAQRRFAYYASINVALLVGLLLERILSRRAATGIADDIPSSRRASRSRVGSPGSDRRFRVRGPFRAAWVRPVLGYGTLLVFGVSAVATLPSRAADFDGPSHGWVAALRWLRDHTPEPFTDPTVYYFPHRAAQADVEGSGSSYGVMSSWDCGYWITAIAHRIPCSNPTQAGAAREGRFFTASNEEEASLTMAEAGARYVILDSAMVAEPLSQHRDQSSKFYSMAAWAGRPLEEYYEPFEALAADGQPRSIYFFHPAYYQSMAVRLYAFGGLATSAERPIVIRYENVLDQGGRSRKRLIETHECSSYAEGLELLQAPTSPDVSTMLVSDDPFRSCVPLDALTHYRSIHNSRWIVRSPDGTLRPEVRIFEYLGAPAATADGQAASNVP